MASMERGFSFRHEGHMFFIYDHKKKKEEDDPKDAILYFYPRSVKTDDQIALVGGIIGITDFCLEFLPQEMPQIIKLCAHNFAMLQHGDYVIGLAGPMEIPTHFLLAHMRFLWSTFVFFQGSITALRKRQSEDLFLTELNMVWDIYLPLCQSQGDLLGQSFQTIPYIQLHRSQSGLFLHASHILQRSLRQNGVLAGALFSKSKVLCSQLSNSLTRRLLLLMMQTQFPSLEVNPDLELPGGVHLINVYLSQEEYQSLSHRRKKKYSTSLQSSMEETVLENCSTSPDADNVFGKSSVLFSDSAISSGGEQIHSHRANSSNSHSRPNSNMRSWNSRSNSADSGQSNCDDNGQTRLRDKYDSRKELTYSPKPKVISGSTDAELYVDSVPGVKNGGRERKNLLKIEEVNCSCDSSVMSEQTKNILSDSVVGSNDVQQSCESKSKSLPGFESPVNKVSRSESQEQAVSNGNREKVDGASLRKNNTSLSLESSSSPDIPKWKELSSSGSRSDGSLRNDQPSDKEGRLSDKENSVPESQNFPLMSREHICGLEKEKNSNLDLEKLNAEKNDLHNVLSNAVEKEENNTVYGDTHDGQGKSDDLNLTRDRSQTHDGLGQSLTRHVSMSGDDSSFHSSSCEMRKEDNDISRKSSVISLVNSDVTSSKDRLTFENLDSENSDCYIISPGPEPAFEGIRIPSGRCSRKMLDGDEAVYSQNSFHSCLDGEDGLVARLTSELRNSEKDNSDWTPLQDRLKEMNLYIQGHSDTLLVLLIEKDVKCSKNYVHSLWKSCLSHLAELDFEVKNVERHMKDESENIGALYQFMKYDSFSQNLSGSAVMPVTSLANEMVDSCVRMHKDFIFMPDVMDATYRSHTACSFGRRTLNSETYFQVGVPSRGGINPGERTFHLEQTAERCLVQDHNINLL